MPAVPDLDLARIRQFCDGRIPAHLRDEARVEAGVRGKSVTIFDCRPPWHPNLTEWSQARSPSSATAPPATPGPSTVRLQESGRPDRLFDDPFAAALVEAAAPVFDDGPSSADDTSLVQLEAEFEVSVAVRTRFYEDLVLVAATAGCRQVVLLGAGLDIRAFRSQWPAGLRLFELDLPEVLAFKERVLSQMGAKPRCVRTAVAVDLREDWPVVLLGAGFKPTARAAPRSPKVSFRILQTTTPNVS